MGIQNGSGIPGKRKPGAMAGNPAIKTDVVRQLSEKRAQRAAEDVNRGFTRTIAHLDELSKLSSEAHKRQNAVLDAATTGSDPKINELARKKAVSAVSKKAPKMDCSGGVCRIIRKKK